MILKHCHAQNFGSYEDIELDFSNLGLTLLYGPTGSGKSTITDLPYWILFGVTAKDGNADEVRSWQRPEAITSGVLEVEFQNGSTIIINRTRGKGSQNDLFWTEDDYTGKPIRGKDLSDTQKRLEERLGIGAALYMAASFYSEFSNAGSFFISRAKDRRALFDSISSVGFANRLGNGASESKKSAKEQLSSVTTGVSSTKDRFNRLSQDLSKAEERETEWSQKQDKRIKTLEERVKNFEQEQQDAAIKIKIERDKSDREVADRVVFLRAQLYAETEKLVSSKEIEDKITKLRKESRCHSCGGPDAKVTKLIESLRSDLEVNTLRVQRIRHLEDKLASAEEYKGPYAGELEKIKKQENHYVEQLVNEMQQLNPYSEQIDALHVEIHKLRDELVSLTSLEEHASYKYEALSEVQDLAVELRGELLKKTVSEIEANTNAYLDRYFDSEFRVGFTVNDDAIDVEVQKDGYVCSYRQLSKGQRGLLRICFSVAVMEAASNRAGVHFNALLFDEALDGLDATLKVKAFDLFQELSLAHPAVLLVDHSPEFQTLFDRKFSVSMHEGRSEITEET